VCLLNFDSETLAEQLKNKTGVVVNWCICEQETKDQTSSLISWTFVIWRRSGQHVHCLTSVRSRTYRTEPGEREEKSPQSELSRHSRSYRGHCKVFPHLLAQRSSSPVAGPPGGLGSEEWCWSQGKCVRTRMFQAQPSMSILEFRQAQGSIDSIRKIRTWMLLVMNICFAHLVSWISGSELQ
jgi:hypothetical protein